MSRPTLAVLLLCGCAAASAAAGFRAPPVSMARGFISHLSAVPGLTPDSAASIQAGSIVEGLAARAQSLVPGSQDARSLMELGRALADRGELDAAVAHLRTAATAERGEVEAAVSLLEAAHRRMQGDAAGRLALRDLLFDAERRLQADPEGALAAIYRERATDAGADAAGGDGGAWKNIPLKKHEPRPARAPRGGPPPAAAAAAPPTLVSRLTGWLRRAPPAEERLSGRLKRAGQAAYYSSEIGGTEVNLVFGDITKAEGVIVVGQYDTPQSGAIDRRGVRAALSRAGFDDELEEFRRLVRAEGALSSGSAVRSGSGRLIHAVSISGAEDAFTRNFRAAYNALKLAGEDPAERSVALPALGTGDEGLSFKSSAEAIFAAVHMLREQGRRVPDVAVYLYQGAEGREAFQGALTRGDYRLTALADSVRRAASRAPAPRRPEIRKPQPPSPAEFVEPVPAPPGIPPRVSRARLLHALKDKAVGETASLMLGRGKEAYAGVHAVAEKTDAGARFYSRKQYDAQLFVDQGLPALKLAKDLKARGLLQGLEVVDVLGVEGLNVNLTFVEGLDMANIMFDKERFGAGYESVSGRYQEALAKSASALNAAGYDAVHMPEHGSLFVYGPPGAEHKTLLLQFLAKNVVASTDGRFFLIDPF